MTFFSQADRGEESVHYDLFPPDRQRLCHVTNASPPPFQFSPFAARIPLEIPLPRPNPGAFQFRPHGLWELLLPTPLKKAGPVNSPPEARPVFCRRSLINQRRGEADTALCAALSPARRLPRLCPKADSLGRKAEGNHPSSQPHVSAASPSPFLWAASLTTCV